MPVVLSDVLSRIEADVLAEAAAGLSFEDGRRTAGRVARAVKDNLQARPGRETDAVLEKVRASLSAHPVFQAVAYPRSFARLLVSRTDGGGQYGDHVDNALMGGTRTDVSFTLFLSRPETYKGGELVVSDRIEERAFRLDRGEVIVYPSTTLHRVAPVTDGSRLVVVGWLQSWVREPDRREILFDLWQAATAAETGGDTDQVRRLAKTRSNLLRMWAG